MWNLEILNLLLDRYERSGHCLPGKSSGRRVMLSLTRGEYPPYRENDPCAAEINHVIQAMAEEGLISFSWRKGYEGWLLDKVWLESDALDRVYTKTGRVPLPDKAGELCKLLKAASDDIQVPWKNLFLQDELSRLQQNLHSSRLLPEDKTQVKALLAVLRYLERGPELMRVVSVNCFHDSKYLERNLLSMLVSIGKAYEPELVAYRALGEEYLTQSVVLEQLGILTYPEIFEFCGDVDLLFGKSVLNTGTFRKGFCLQSENLEFLHDAGLKKTQTVLFVENRTNYRSVISKGLPEGTLVVYHGGFYSPAKRKLFCMLSEGLSTSVDILFWGDIDLGGFLMFTRLKKDLFPGLVPWRMGLTDYEQYKDYGVCRSSAYLASLKQRMEEQQFDSVFFPVAEGILENSHTIEQEIML